MTKSARRLKKKTAHMMNATKTAACHLMMIKTAQHAMKTILETGLNTEKEGRKKLMKNADIQHHTLG